MVKGNTQRVRNRFIQDFKCRKACFEKYRTVLLKMMREVTILCGIGACATILGPGDTVPTVWPSPEDAQQLMRRHTLTSHRLRKSCTPQGYIQRKIKYAQGQIHNLKERNHKKQMSILMHQIHHDRKSLSDFETDDLISLLSYVEAKLQLLKPKTLSSEDSELNLSNENSSNNIHNVPPPSSPFSKEGIEFWANIDDNDEFFSQESIKNLLKNDPVQMNSAGTSDNINKASNLGVPPPPPPPPHTHLGTGGVDMVLPQINSQGYNGGFGLLPEGDFGGLFNFENDNFGSGVWPLGNTNFGGFDVNGSGEFELMSNCSFIGLVNSAPGLVNGSCVGDTGGSGMWPSCGSFGSTDGGSDMTVPSFNIDGTFKGKGKLDENLGVNSDYGAAAFGGSIATNFGGTNNARNLNLEFPFHGNFSSGSSAGNDV
ncbi:hypothetical protein RJT34_19523 [Clitoria ternatea]|uniref:MADS-box domain-containing protein n=1 Tax=Clitoria ternatea TaxID=43366 RepID=A0AAN9IR65_CLITE